MTTIRRATDDDRVAIARLHEASIRALGPSHYTPEEVESWAANIRPENYPIEHEIYVAVDDAEVIGFGHYHDGEIAAVYVHPAHTGRGVGRLLMAKLEECGRREGAERLFLNASLNAERFYEACGYRRVGEALYRTRGGVEIRCARMEKGVRG
jgi:putative acetyltransferase